MSVAFWTTTVNYLAWYIFVFIAVTWLIVLFINRDEFSASRRKRVKRFPSVSILIPAYNEGKNIERIVRSILRVNYPKDLLEVIVINDASTDRTREIVEGMEGVVLINNARNRGKAHSLNRALKIAKGELVACVDADSVVEKNILMKMVGHFENPKVASVTPALKVLKPKNFIERIQSAEYLLNIFLRKSLEMIDSIHVTPGVFSIYRKSVLGELGGFDENNLTEDMEIALRIHDAGYRIENRLDAFSYTICPPGLRSLFKQRLRWYRGALQNTVKYKHMIFNPKYGNLGMFLLPFNFISILAVITIFMILLWNFFDAVRTFIWQLYLIDWDLLVFLRNFEINWEVLLLNTFTTSFILMVMGLVLGGYLLLKSFSVTKEKFSFNKLGYFTYLIVYPIIMMSFWLTAMAFEIFRIERKW
ncbi:MAG: glycosyltransferase [Candidatus Aenigmarchaeota archaeon]|nr:glycosyltransferase [Candidatus Aenigmarchaeota archaeon]NIQ17774.1 glycosyltransferase [Candidatus Aenigmarchaeota archaeon]NIS73094.1 glycosyltransferase [Candidatus Aenigmarchaeota archaeon]